MSKKFIVLVLVISLICTIAFIASPAVPAYAASVSQIGISYVDSLPNQPVNYSMIDWDQRARNFDSIVFDFSTSGTYLPIAQWDTTHYNMSTTTFKLPAYVGPKYGLTDGFQEALAGMASVLGGALTGINKSNQTGNGYTNVNFADMCRTYYTSEGIISNNPNNGKKSKDTEFWYILTPTLEFAALDYLYPSTAMDTIFQNTADKWYDAIVRMGGTYLDFNHWSYDFTNNVPVDGAYTEPDAAIGAGLFQYMAYKKFGTAKYLDAAKWCMKFLQDQGYNPTYECLEYFGPLFAALLNAEQGQSNDVTKMVNWAFDTNSPHRPNWGAVKGTFGGYGMDGLMGSSSDNGGNYAFAMNTFAGVMGMAPLARYDQRYARAMGKYILNAASNSRLFYGDQLDAAHQDNEDWTADPNHGIPYEGLRYRKIGDSNYQPYATGDPLTYGWDFNTNFGVYSGALSGVLGGIVRTTNVSKILQLDLLKTDFFHSTAYPSYLYYNPLTSNQSVEINVGGTACDIYDAVSDTFLSRNVTGTQTFSIPADTARVIVLGPANGSITTSGNNLLLNNVFVGYRAPTNIAAGKTATASSTANGNVANNVTDGNQATRWESSSSDPQWVYVDLGSSQTVGRVKLNWEVAYGKTYKIQVSDNASTWTDVYSTTTGDGGIDDISFAPTSARYVRMYGTQRGTQYAYSMYEFEVYVDALSNVDVSVGGTASDNGASNPANEDETKAFDKSSFTKWLVYSTTGELRYDFAGTAAYKVTKYSVTSANDVQGRDPKNWQLQGSDNGTSWTTVDTQTNITFATRYQTKTYSISNNTAYQMYRLNVTANNGDAYLQLAELQLFGN